MVKDRRVIYLISSGESKDAIRRDRSSGIFQNMSNDYGDLL